MEGVAVSEDVESFVVYFGVDGTGWVGGSLRWLLRDTTLVVVV